MRTPTPDSLRVAWFVDCKRAQVTQKEFDPEACCTDLSSVIRVLPDIGSRNSVSELAGFISPVPRVLAGKGQGPENPSG